MESESRKNESCGRRLFNFPSLDALFKDIRYLRRYGLKTGTEKKPAIGPKKGIGQEKPRPSN